jgi:1,3-propanediol dehydrogenase/alcohol dehydrogenase
MSYQFQMPPKVVYGQGALEKVGDITKLYGKKALLVTGKHSAKANGVLDRTIHCLERAGVEWNWFNGADPDPTMGNVEAGVAAGMKETADVVVALGGGSAIDTGKAIAVMMNNPGKISDYEFNEIPGPCLPVIAVPTTAGTGSEATKGAVITDEERMVKMGINSEKILPKAAILDPELTLSLPDHITAATGMDALTHAVETYIAQVATPMSKPYSLLSIRLLYENFEKVMTHGQDIEVRENMLIGQFYAGCAIANSATALVHAMSRPLGVYFHIPHGLANAILLTRVMRFNAETSFRPFYEMAPMFGIKAEGRDEKQTAELCIQAIEDIFNMTGLPKRLSQVGAKKEMLPKLAHDAAVNRSNKINIRVAEERQILDMYYELF